MTSKIKLHSAIPEEDRSIVKKQAKKKGFGLLDYDKYYTLSKIGSKHYKHSHAEIIIREGQVQIVGSSKHVSLLVLGNRIGEWFRTSPVESVRKVGKTFIVETQNSTYELK